MSHIHFISSQKVDSLGNSEIFLKEVISIDDKNITVLQKGS